MIARFGTIFLFGVLVGGGLWDIACIALGFYLLGAAAEASNYKGEQQCLKKTKE